MKRYLLFMIACVCAVTGAWADEVSYPYNFGTNSSVAYDTSSGVLTVTIGTTGDFATFVNKLAWSGTDFIELNKTGNVRIVCTNSATISGTEVSSFKTAKSNNGFTMLDLTDAAFDADATITSIMANGVRYVSLPSGKSISNVTLPASNSTALTGVVTSNGSSATYTAYNGDDYTSSFGLLSNTTLTSIGNWTITNGTGFISSDNVTVSAGGQTNGFLQAVVANSTATTLSVTCDGITQNANFTLSPSSSVISLTVSGLQYSSDNYSTVTVGSGSALTSLTIEDSTVPYLTISGCAELTTADLTGVKHTTSGVLSVSFANDPKLERVTLYRSSSYTTYNPSGTTPASTDNSGTVTVTWAAPSIPIEYDDCKVTINLASRDTKTMSTLISEAKTHLGSTDICTLIVTGELTTEDLQSLDDASNATRIDLSEATLASGASVNSIQVPTTLLSLVLPPGNTVSSTLATTLSSATNFEYVYSNTSDGGATVPTYVWIAKTGVMPHVFANESSLISCVYLKVSAKSGIALESTSVDLSETGLTNLQYLDVSESGLTTDAVQYYKTPHYYSYRIILPNNWSGDDMARFAANPNVGAIAAVYSYHGTTLKIMEIVDNSYSPAALADPRIMKSTTTEVDIVSGYYNGQTYAQFGINLLEALNNMGKSSFSVTKDNVTTNYNNTAGLNVTTINIETTSAAPNTLTFTNPVITTLNIENLSQTNAQLNVDACSALTTLDLSGSSLQSVDASTSSLTSVDLSGTVISGATDFSDATALATFTTTDETSFGGALNLTSSALTSFTSAARISGDITLNASNNLASIDVSSATFTTTTSKIHIDESSTEADGNTAIIAALKVSDTKTIKVPTGFDSENRIHPYTEAADYIEELAAVADAVTYAASDMVFHDNTSSDGYYNTYRYWYQGSSTSNQIATLGTSTTRTLQDIIEGNSNLNPTVAAHADLTNNTHVKIKVVGPLTATCLTKLKNLNCTTLDLSEATITVSELQTALASDILHANTKFLVLPSTCTRDNIINGTQLANLANVYSVIAVETTNEGRNLTSWSRVSGALQPAVVSALSSAASWTLEPTGLSARNVYTSSVSNFKVVKLSGLINSYDLAGPVQGGTQLDADGHLSWVEPVEEGISQTRTPNGGHYVYGPFSACFLLTEIDLRDAYFEEFGDNSGLAEVYRRYYFSDMTLSALGIISTATYKVVIPQDSRVKEIPADFLRCATYIRAICIPSNIQAIRTRAFYTLDYVWTTGNTADPEGTNTRLDNGAKLNDGTQVWATIYEYNTVTNKYEYRDNPAFLNSYYTANYSGENGGGTYTFGSTIKLIETGAFANTEPNVKDVYVLNTIAPECHVDAFNTVMYTGNGGYNPTAVSAQGIITRAAYYNGRWITMLHYPRQTTDPQIQRYTDPTRNYSIATGERDGKGSPLYFPNQSEFIRAYQQGTYGYTWNAWDPTRTYGSVDNGTLTNTTEPWNTTDQGTANALYNSNTVTNSDLKQYYVFYDTGANNDAVSPKANTPTPVDYYKINWNTSSYTYSTDATQGNLYPRSEIEANYDADGSSEKTSKDYRGWHQFVLNAYAANTLLQEEPYRSYITDDDWWTFCPTFDITRNQAIELFGSPSTSAIPYVSRLLYVRREYDNERIILNFSNNLMLYKEDRENATDQHGRKTNGIVNILSSAPEDDDIVMSAGVPYLIKPNIVGGSIRQFLVFVSADEMAKSTQDTEHYRYIADGNLYTKIQESQAMSGSGQIALVESGLYDVPVFVNGNTITEGHDAVTYTLDGHSYNKSTAWKYTFVGSFYLSPLPKYSYFLGKASEISPAQFFYNNYEPYSSDNFRWANETGVICPTTTSNSLAFTVTSATDMQHPAHWSITTQLNDDSFSPAASRSYYNMVFGSGDVDIDDATGVVDMKISESDGSNVFSVDGQLKGNSLNGLAKGVYIMNGKKYVVK